MPYIVQSGASGMTLTFPLYYSDGVTAYNTAGATSAELVITPPPGQGAAQIINASTAGANFTVGPNAITMTQIPTMFPTNPSDLVYQVQAIFGRASGSDKFLIGTILAKASLA